MRPGAPTLPTTAGPVWMPMRRRTGRRPLALRRSLSSRSVAAIAWAARQARSGVIGLQGRRAPERHHGIADILVDRALLGVDAAGEQAEMAVEELGQLGRRQAAGDRR